MSPAPKQKATPPPESSVVDGIETEGWRPEPGDEITGVVVSLGSGHSDFRARTGNGAYPILTIAAETERNLNTPEEVTTHEPPQDTAVHAFQSVLYNELMAQRPAVGEKVTITYGGKRQHRTIASQTVAVYKVRVHREGSQANGWDDLFGPPPGRQQAVVAVDKQTGELLPGEDDLPF